MLLSIYFQMADAPPTISNEQLPEKQRHMTEQPDVHMPMNLPQNNQIITPNAGYPQQNVAYPPQNVIYPQQNTLYPQQNSTYPQQNVPVTMYAQPQIQLNYNSTVARMCGIFQIALGILAIVLQCSTFLAIVIVPFVGTVILCGVLVSKHMLNFYC